jgi:hypothetical protein
MPNDTPSLPLCATFIRDMPPFIDLLAHAFRLDETALMNIALTMEETSDLSKLFAYVDANAKFPQGVGYAVTPILKQVGSRQLAIGLELDLMSESYGPLFGFCFDQDECWVWGEGFFLGEDPENCFYTPTLRHIFAEPEAAPLLPYLYRVIFAYPTRKDEVQWQVRAALLRSIPYQEIDVMTVRPDVHLRLPLLLTLIDGALDTPKCQLYARWLELLKTDVPDADPSLDDDTNALDESPLHGRLLQKLFAPVRRYLRITYIQNRVLGEIVGLRAHLKMGGGLTFDINLVNGEVSLDLGFSHITPGKGVEVDPELWGELLGRAGTQADMLRKVAIRLLHMFEPLVRRMTPEDGLARGRALRLVANEYELLTD